MAGAEARAGFSPPKRRAVSTRLSGSIPAKAANTADFIVNLKKPLEDKDVPAVGFEYKIPPATALVGTYDSYAQSPATATLAQTAQIVLRDGEIQVEKKKVVPVHKPAAGHKPAAH